MFTVNSSAPIQQRYEIEWLKEPGGQFDAKVTRWFHHLDKSQIMGGPTKEVRKALTAEFLAAIYVYDLILKLQKTELREAGIGNADLSVMELTFAISEAQDRLSSYERLHRDKFKKPPLLGPEYANLQNVAMELIRAARAANVKRAIMKRKVRLVEYWIHGLTHGHDELIPGLSLEIQELGNCNPEQVQLILEVMTKDAAKLMRMPDPTAKYKIDTGSGFDASKSIEWTKEDFQRTVKAEASVSYGIKMAGEGVWEITGLKAAVKAELFAGARVEGSFEGSIGKGGIEAKGEVEAMVGVKATFKAELEVLGIFTAELGGEAFAGAMAKAEFEFSLTRADGLKISVGAEAFAGARISGTAKFEFKLQGLSILSGSATGKLSAGIGAAFKFEFEMSPMGATSFTLGAEVTVGLGAGGETEVKFDPGNLSLAAKITFFKAYYKLLKSDLETYAYETYFQDLEVNDARLKKALEYLEARLKDAEAQYDAAGNANIRLLQIKRIADSRWSPRGALPMIRPKLGAFDLEPVQTGMGPTRPRSKAVTSRPTART